MKKNTYPCQFRCAKNIIFFFFLLMFFVSSCGRKQEAPQDIEQIERQIVEENRDARKEIIHMGDYEVTDSIRENGHRYVYTIARQAADSLGIVTDAEGFRTADNYISLAIKQDGAAIFSKRFTRRAFKAGISDAEFSHYVLMNMVFDRVTDSGLRFIVSVGEGSGDDMFVQFALTVGPDGSTNIVPHEVFDEDEIDRM